MSTRYCGVTPINLPIVRIPYPDTGVQTARRNFLAVKSNRIDLAEMSRKGPQALALGYAPDFCSRVVASRHNNIAVYLETPDTSLVSDENVFAKTLVQVPNAKCGVS